MILRRHHSRERIPLGPTRELLRTRQFQVEAMKEQSHKDECLLRGNKPSRAHVDATTKGSQALAGAETFALEESIGFELVHIVAEDLTIVVQLTAWDHDAVAFAENFAADERVLGDEADRGSGSSHAKRLHPD